MLYYKIMATTLTVPNLVALGSISTTTFLTPNATGITNVFNNISTGTLNLASSLSGVLNMGSSTTSGIINMNSGISNINSQTGYLGYTNPTTSQYMSVYNWVTHSVVASATYVGVCWGTGSNLYCAIENLSAQVILSSDGIYWTSVNNVGTINSWQYSNYKSYLIFDGNNELMHL